ncbi:basic leucine zipper 23-like [Senna tora]|uniref:Basic leucine zipper 23-like n=1 Tax=Senna tora TaxID=362788 RepID=A0A834SXL0_9FABA|nr:basic leucine zipper 23-like [Senna tora]
MLRVSLFPLPRATVSAFSVLNWDFIMDDGELDFSNQEVFSSTNVGDLPSSMDSFFEELYKDTHACTHTHTCNPPGPDNSHTHTCYHVHTKIVSASSEDKVGTDDSAESAEKKSKKRPLGNREAVRKYREKKKARAASLEDEVIKLRALNQHLLRKLQGQSALEAEIARLKCLLVDIRGRIDGEIGSFPYQKSTNSNLPMPHLPGSYVINPCNMQCGDQVYCLHPGADGKNTEGASFSGQGLNGCEFESIQCPENQTLGLKDLSHCGVGQTMSNIKSSIPNKRKAKNKKHEEGIKEGKESHDGTGCGVLVTEGRGVPHLRGAGTCELRHVRVIGASHVAGRRFLIVDSGSIGVGNDVVWDIRPELGLLSGPVSYPRHHLGRLHVSDDDKMVFSKCSLHGSTGFAFEHPSFEAHPINHSLEAVERSSKAAENHWNKAEEGSL